MKFKKKCEKFILALLAFSLASCGAEQPQEEDKPDEPISYKYTVTWKNYDGSILETDTNVEQGTTPSFDGTTPSRDPSDQYSYIFTNWVPAISPVTSDITYTAEFSQTTREYTVKWQNYDGSIIKTDTVPYGSTPEYTGENPERPSTDEFSYLFSGWNNEIVPVTGDVTYTATYTKSVNCYSVTWKNYDGTILEVDQDVPYGTVPTYDGKDPIKTSTNEYSYLFNGWTENVVAVTSDVTYTAAFSQTIREYTVKWENYDGSIIKTDTVPYGSTPEYTGENPERPSTAEFSYLFSGWNNEIVPVTGDVTYTATYTKSVNCYSVTWKNYDGSLLRVDRNIPYGTMPVYDGENPTKAADVQYSYLWSGWTTDVVPVTDDVEYTAKFEASLNSYTVTWKNYDDSVLKTDDVLYGETPLYSGDDPVKPADAQYTYNWCGWEEDIVPVKGDVEYTAKFVANLNAYTVTWRNFDNSILETDKNVYYGTVPTFDGNKPIKPKDEKYTYEFDGWDKEVVAVTGNVTYTATYNSTQYGYSINFNLNGGSSKSYVESKIVTEISSDTFFYDVAYSGYNFRGWSYQGLLIYDENGNKVNNLTLVDNMTFDASFSDMARLNIVSNYEDGGEVNGGGEYTYYSYVDLSAVPNQGYKFVGWYQIDNVSLKYDVLIATEADYKFLMWTEDIVIMAKFERLDYKLHLHSNNTDLGQVFDSSSGSHIPYSETNYSHTYLSSVTISAITITDKYRFLGWYDKDNKLVSPNAVYTFSMTNYDYDLEAKWDRFTITYNMDGGDNNLNNPTVFSSDDQIELLTPTKEFYDFVGWKVDGLPVEKIDGGWHKDVIVTAVWTPTDYKITYNLDGGTNNVENPDTYNVESSDIVFADPTRDYYDFVNWTDKNGNPIEKIESGSHGDVELSANWTPIEFSITYNLNEGSNNQSNPKTYNIESNDIVFADPTRDYYDFVNWTDKNGNPIEKIESGSYGDVELSANWTPIEFSITYNLNGGTNNSNNPNTYTISDGKVQLHDPTKDNDLFEGWYLDSEYKNKVTELSIDAINSSKKIELFAKWANLSEFIYTVDGFDITITGVKDKTSLISVDLVLILNNLKFYNIVKISDYAFSGCSSLTSITIPNSVTSIGYYAFYGCSSLTSITIPNSVTTIGGYAFYGCYSLTSITIPNSVTSIGIYAFSGSSLTIYCEATSRPSGWDPYWNNSGGSVVWDCVDHFEKDGINYGLKSDGSLVVASLADKSLTEIIIPSEIDGKQVVSIAYSAFRNCSSLTSVTIPNSVTTIGDHAFWGCSSLTSITIPNSVTSIGIYAFSGCNSLTSITIPNSVTSIGYHAFGSSLTIYCETPSEPLGWEYDWNYSDSPVVWDCVDHFEKDGINYGLKSDGSLVVASLADKSLTEIIIPSKIDGKQVVGIVNSAFRDCSSLTSVIIPNSITSIGYYAFRDCSSLTIYCEAPSKPSGWSSSWNYSDRPVVWGYNI